MSISEISQLLLTQFWWNFKGRLLWIFRTDSNCQGDICPRNICPRNICPFQEYLSCYWPDLDLTLKVPETIFNKFHLSWWHLSRQHIYVLATFVHISNISAVIDPFLTKLFVHNIFGAYIFVNKFFFNKILWPQIFFDSNFF